MPSWGGPKMGGWKKIEKNQKTPISWRSVPIFSSRLSLTLTHERNEVLPWKSASGASRRARSDLIQWSGHIQVIDPPLPRILARNRGGGQSLGGRGLKSWMRKISPAALILPFKILVWDPKMSKFSLAALILPLEILFRAPQAKTLL